MATVAIEERELLKSLRWWDGFVVALANPGFLIGSLGFSIGSLGGWGAMLLWGVSMFLGTLQNWIYAETATMFPNKTGGIALYANEGWRRYCTLVGPVATFGYWFAWSTVLSIFGIVVGSLIQTQWFSKSVCQASSTAGLNVTTRTLRAPSRLANRAASRPFPSDGSDRG